MDTLRVWVHLRVQCAGIWHMQRGGGTTELAEILSNDGELSRGKTVREQRRMLGQTLQSRLHCASPPLCAWAFAVGAREGEGVAVQALESQP